MISRLLKVPTYSKYMYLEGWTPQEIFAAGKQHCYELAMLKKEVPIEMEQIIDKALDEILKDFE